MNFDKTKTLLLLAGVGFIAWKVYQASKAVDDAVESVDDARVRVGNAIGLSIYDVFNPRPAL